MVSWNIVITYYFNRNASNDMSIYTIHAIILVQRANHQSIPYVASGVAKANVAKRFLSN